MYCRGSAILLMVSALAGGAWAHDTIPGSVLSIGSENWSIAPDPENVGRDQEWWKGPVPGAKPATVPGIIQEALPAYHGVAWYWHEVTPPANPHMEGRCLLRFGAVDYLADVWVNDVYVGGHEGGETPFTLDVTDAIKPDAPNRLAVRVLNPVTEPIDGIVLVETPHRDKGATGIPVGGMYNSGGILEPLELIWAPAVRIADVFARPDWKTGRVRVQLNVRNAGSVTAKGRIEILAGPAFGSEVVAATTVEDEFPVGDTQVEAAFTVPTPRLWELSDPYLYRLSARLSAEPTPAYDECVLRFGFRDFRVEKGYFRLNGKRIFLKSAHTLNHCPVGQNIPPANAPDLLRKDLLYAKAAGFNAVRFIAGIPRPYQLDLCDEIGLMVYEENFASWCLADSPKMAERFDRSLREMILRDRNHPSVVIWGLLNETPDGPVFRQAVASLPLVRSLDDTRLVLLGSGRWDGQYNIGSVSNPGSDAWECVWGVESPDNQTPAKPGRYGGYYDSAGDAHAYPPTPHTSEIENDIRMLGQNTKPVFLSEYGIGSLMNAIRELRTYEEHDANPDWEDFKYFKATEEKLTADWHRFGMEGVYAFPEDMLRDSQRMHGRQRTLGFDLIRSNPQICGYNLTGLLDHVFGGEGLWTFWREWKPGIVDVLQDGWAPLRWCMFVAPMHGYAGRPIKIESVLATEDVLRPGEYPVTLRVVGPKGIAWEQKTVAKIPEPAAGEDGPLAVPVFAGDVTLAEAGEYEFAASMDRGGAPFGGRLKFQVSEIPSAKVEGVTTLNIDQYIQDWLKARGVVCVPYETAPAETRQIILVGNLPDSSDASVRENLMRRVSRGDVAVFLEQQAFKRGDDPVGWLPLENKGRRITFPDWLYHKECVAKAHPVFEGLQAKGVMDWDYYGPVISHFFFDGQDTPDEVMAAAFVVCHNFRPDGYGAGVMLGTYAFGEGAFVLNTFNVLENIDKHPAADRLLLNLIAYCRTKAQGAVAPLPQDFDARLKEIGY